MAAACTSGKNSSASGSSTTSGASTSTSGVTTTLMPPAATIAWRTCGTNQCGTLSVPLDYSNPTGEHISIAIDRHRATGQKIGSLLVNPGGPGGSGYDFLDTALTYLTPQIRARFDIVGFDPRGVGRSSPVRCMDAKNLDAFFASDPVPDNAQEHQALVDIDKAFVAGCQARSAKLLPFVGTADAARDMDQMREALGDPKLTYVGFSYGTYLGAIYANLFPRNVRALVLDGAIDPSLDTMAANAAQGVGFDRALNAFFADCTTNQFCSWQPGKPLKQAFDELAASIDAHPLQVGSRQLTSGTFFLGVATPLYDRDSWDALASGLQAAATGDGSDLLQYADLLAGRQANGTYDNSQEANQAVNCIDKPSPRDVAAYDQAAQQEAKVAPEFGPAIVYSGIVCGLWPVPAKGQAAPIHAAGSPPIMVVGTTDDPATPYAGAQALARQLEHGILVTRDGEGHTGYRSSPCVQRYADAYLIDLTVPQGNPTCTS